MIYLNKNNVNTVILELTAKSSLLSPNYLFEFINEVNPNTKLYFTSNDLSSYKCAYNRFQIIETGSTYTNYTAGTINARSGSYKYNVYESTGVTLSISATTGKIISTGKAYVAGVDSEIPSIYR